jgi:hypothetical protein
MSHLTTELCEKYPGERIQQWEYDLEAQEWAAIGFVPAALADGQKLHLPRACYFSQDATKADVLRAWGRIKSRLDRKVKLECTIGLSFGKDLDPVAPRPATAAEAKSPPADPLEDALSTAFNRLFRPTAV